jgi:hypothetical protein
MYQHLLAGLGELAKQLPSAQGKVCGLAAETAVGARAGRR